MSNLTNAVAKLLSDKTVDLVIGYAKGRPDRAIAVFLTSEAGTEKLIFDESCTQNLIVYIHKPEVKKYKKIAIVVNDPAMRAFLQLASENQIKSEKYILLKQEADSSVLLFENFKDIEQYISTKPGALPPYAAKKLDEILALDNDNKWKFWVNELSSCIKCYACRSACPMCYCTQCTVECNQPQWIQTFANGSGNMDWHILRAMHMAGRCISCGECTRACPVEIPIGLLSGHLNRELKAMFGDNPGMKADADYTLSTFKTEDKEDFFQ